MRMVLPAAAYLYIRPWIKPFDDHRDNYKHSSKTLVAPRLLFLFNRQHQCPFTALLSKMSATKPYTGERYTVLSLLVCPPESVL